MHGSLTEPQVWQRKSGGYNWPQFASSPFHAATHSLRHARVPRAARCTRRKRQHTRKKNTRATTAASHPVSPAPAFQRPRYVPRLFHRAPKPRGSARARAAPAAPLPRPARALERARAAHARRPARAARPPPASPGCTRTTTMREIVHIQAGQCGNQIGGKVRGRRGGVRRRRRDAAGGGARARARTSAPCLAQRRVNRVWP
jgi:hypothetical protein